MLSFIIGQAGLESRVTTLVGPASFGLSSECSKSQRPQWSFKPNFHYALKKMTLCFYRRTLGFTGALFPFQSVGNQGLHK